MESEEEDGGGGGGGGEEGERVRVEMRGLGKLWILLKEKTLLSKIQLQWNRIWMSSPHRVKQKCDYYCIDECPAAPISKQSLIVHAQEDTQTTSHQNAGLPS